LFCKTRQSWFCKQNILAISLLLGPDRLHPVQNFATMAPPAAYAIDNMQDVGGMGFEPGMDKHALTTDTVDAPLSVAIEKSGKPVKYWE